MYKKKKKLNVHDMCGNMFSTRLGRNMLLYFKGWSSRICSVRAYAAPRFN